MTPILRRLFGLNQIRPHTLVISNLDHPRRKTLKFKAKIDFSRLCQGCFAESGSAPGDVEPASAETVVARRASESSVPGDTAPELFNQASTCSLRAVVCIRMRHQSRSRVIYQHRRVTGSLPQAAPLRAGRARQPGLHMVHG
jgi:hypothetical protein